MAKFEEAYKVVKNFEGGYANIKSDKGGETYAGIARNIFPENDVWTYIDFMKRTKFQNGIPRNTVFPDISGQVENFYRGLWNENNLQYVNSQKVATLIFDYLVHSGPRGIKNVQKVLRVEPDGLIGPVTLSAINNRDASALYSEIIKEREKFLESLIAKDPTQEKFRAGWISRINFLSDMNGINFSLLVVLFLILILTSIL